METEMKKKIIERLKKERKDAELEYQLWMAKIGALSKLIEDLEKS